MQAILCGLALLAGTTEGETLAARQVLERFHTAAAKADGPTYFGCLADNAVFLGTDASERWTKPQFEKFCQPYFEKGQGWLYEMTDRHLTLGPDGQTIWFDELLTNKKYGTCRGSGVLIKTAAGWKIAQYNLSIPIPNEATAKVLPLLRKSH